MKVFISGPMSGKPNFNREAFFKAQEELEKLGYSVWNPAWLAYPSDTEFSKNEIHDIDIEALKHCDVIYMLKGWQDSKGALAEYEIAKKRGLLTMYEDPFYFDTLPKQKNLFAECYTVNITNLRKETSDKINGLNQAINDVEANLDNFKDETDGKTNDIYDTLHRHGENLDTCEKICANRYASNLNKINKLDKDVKSIKELLRLDSDKNTPAFAYNNCRLDNHADRIGSLEDEVEDIKKSIGTDNLQEQLNKDFDDVYTEFQNTKDKVNEIEFSNIDMSCKMSSAIDEMTKVKETVKGLNSLVATLGERNDVLSDNIYELQRIIISSDIENISVKAMNQKLIDLGKKLDIYIDYYNDLNIRLKAIEKRDLV